MTALTEAKGIVTDAIWRRLIRHGGWLRSTRLLPARIKASFAARYAYQERAEIALTVAGMYPGGDYFEFGSASLRTFRSFLSAFDLNGLPARLPGTRFFAFDLFGDPDTGKGVPRGEEWYFDQYRRAAYGNPAADLRRHGLLLDRCETVKGYFEETLSDPALLARLRRERRRVGFAFLDCNISSSYRTCFAFLEEFMRTDRCFVYMDEYFLCTDLPQMFEDFCGKLRERYRLRAYYVRNAGAFGALFCLMTTEPPPTAPAES